MMMMPNGIRGRSDADADDDNLSDGDGDQEYQDALESETTTLSSSPTSTSPPDYKLQFDEALIQEKFSKLGLSRYLLDANIGPEPEVDNDGGEDGELTDSMRLDEKRIPLLRSTSLKSGKTPPNTPSQKKFVRFADSLGLELAFVRNIYQDDLPTVPKSAYLDLKCDDFLDDTVTICYNNNNNSNNSNAVSNNNNNNNSNNNINSNSRRILGKIIGTHTSNSIGFTSTQQPFPWFNTSSTPSTLVPEFVQPCILSNFISRVNDQRVCLENCVVTTGSSNLSITCIVRVLNISFEKEVYVRYTLTEWRSWVDVKATYLQGSSDGYSDRFTVTFEVNPICNSTPLLPCEETVQPGQRVLFAIRYIANNEESWDNNMGLNYSLIYRV